MNIPNKLTVSRLFAAPLFFIVFFLSVWLPGVFSFKLTLPVLWVILILSEVSDALDGHYARKFNLVSDVGKLLDPFSDVFLRITYFVCFLMYGLMPVVAFMIILWRELAITFIRLLMVKEGITLAARKGGKLKAIMYFISGIFAMAVMTINFYITDSIQVPLEVTSHILFYISAVAALVSFADYLRLFFKTEIFKSFVKE